MTNKEGNKILVVTRCIIKDSSNRILILKRGSKDIRNPHKWELPGGKLEKDENIEIAIEREINEEINLIVNVFPKRFYCHSSVLLQEQSKYKDFTYIVLTATASYIGGKVKISEEHTSYEWVDQRSIFDYNLALDSKRALTSYINDMGHQDQETSEGKLPIWLIARALIKNKEEKYLLLRRSKKESYAQEWEIPGGKLKSLETLNENLKREVFEETGFIIEVEGPPVNISSSISSADESPYKGYTYINITHKAHVVAGSAKLSGEHDTYSWFTKDELFKLNLVPYLRMPLTEILLKI